MGGHHTVGDHGALAPSVVELGIKRTAAAKLVLRFWLFSVWIFFEIDVSRILFVTNGVRDSVSGRNGYLTRGKRSICLLCGGSKNIADRFRKQGDRRGPDHARQEASTLNGFLIRFHILSLREWPPGLNQKTAEKS